VQKTLNYQGYFIKKFILDNRMSDFKVNENVAFYLQNTYFKDWVDNSIIFLEIDDLDDFRKELFAHNLVEKYQMMRI
jgi:hypothetical protein